MINPETGYLASHDHRIYKTTNGGLPTGIDHQEYQKMTVQITPNPTNGKFQVSGNKFQATSPQIIRVYNSQGVKVLEVEVPALTEKVSLDATGWLWGLYFVQVECGGEVRSSKLVVY